MPPPFERSEYAARLRRTRAAMREAGLDVLPVFHQEHMFYVALGDPGLVTAGGHERLTRLSRDLTVR